MSTLPHKTAIAPDGNVIFTDGGVLAPGWKAAIAILDLEAKLAAGEMQDLSDEGEIDSSTGVEVLSRLEACERAVALLRVQGRRIGLDV